ncbi:DCC1-like thiol-disulfide oxidoreductase family protein [Haloquadratum walsbyi]|uniref:DUF393 family protein n=1 Tax=Haloquadratum walsbyi (strain DSM 16854 / JCM 12705 / C23) TaxID=768065 RepID=G0LJ92_HALWC|nr:DCC1-like thiol-disulfide oxidoreductase family protein [Haloquadratum walsbyi]CCC40660.1 uncharacterized protein Hqrw_2848 [Haloquadratum walsbyi C23]
MPEYDSVLIYDGECPYCSIAARALERLDAVGAISWYDETAQQFLEAQFDETPFAMFFVDNRCDQVYAGRAAAEELAQRASMPDIVSQLVRKNYDQIASLVGTATGRGRDPDDYHEIYPLKKTAASVFSSLAASSTTQASA